MYKNVFSSICLFHSFDQILFFIHPSYILLVWYLEYICTCIPPHYLDPSSQNGYKLPLAHPQQSDSNYNQDNPLKCRFDWGSC